MSYKRPNPAATEYEQLKAAGLSDHNITMLRNTGASHGAILAFARSVALQCAEAAVSTRIYADQEVA